jgi:hypothetical protein
MLPHSFANFVVLSTLCFEMYGSLLVKDSWSANSIRKYLSLRMSAKCESRRNYRVWMRRISKLCTSPAHLSFEERRNRRRKASLSLDTPHFQSVAMARSSVEYRFVAKFKRGRFKLILTEDFLRFLFPRPRRLASKLRGFKLNQELPSLRWSLLLVADVDKGPPSPSEPRTR